MPESEIRPDIDPQLLSILRCPLTRSPLRVEGTWLVGEVGGLMRVRIDILSQERNLLVSLIGQTPCLIDHAPRIA
mgnify:CR=1 FL=1